MVSTVSSAVTALPGSTRRCEIRPEIGASDAGEAEVEALRADIGAGRRDLGLAGAERRLALLDLLDARRPLRRQRPRAGELGAGVDQSRLGPGELGPRLIELGLGRALVDGEEELAGADIIAVAEMDRLQIAGDARLHLDALDRLEAADIIVPVDDLAAPAASATVTAGGGGACCSSPAPQAASAAASTSATQPRPTVLFLTCIIAKRAFRPAARAGPL